MESGDDLVIKALLADESKEFALNEISAVIKDVLDIGKLSHQQFNSTLGNICTKNTLFRKTLVGAICKSSAVIHDSQFSFNKEGLVDRLWDSWFLKCATLPLELRTLRKAHDEWKGQFYSNPNASTNSVSSIKATDIALTNEVVEKPTSTLPEQLDNHLTNKSTAKNSSARSYKIKAPKQVGSDDDDDGDDSFDNTLAAWNSNSFKRSTNSLTKSPGTFAAPLTPAATTIGSLTQDQQFPTPNSSSKGGLEPLGVPLVSPTGSNALQTPNSNSSQRNSMIIASRIAALTTRSHSIAAMALKEKEAVESDASGVDSLSGSAFEGNEDPIFGDFIEQPARRNDDVERATAVCATANPSANEPTIKSKQTPHKTVNPPTINHNTVSQLRNTVQSSRSEVNPSFEDAAPLIASTESSSDHKQSLVVNAVVVKFPQAVQQQIDPEDEEVDYSEDFSNPSSPIKAEESMQISSKYIENNDNSSSEQLHHHSLSMISAVPVTNSITVVPLNNIRTVPLEHESHDNYHTKESSAIPESALDLSLENEAIKRIAGFNAINVVSYADFMSPTADRSIIDDRVPLQSSQQKPLEVYSRPRSASVRFIGPNIRPLNAKTVAKPVSAGLHRPVPRGSLAPMKAKAAYIKGNSHLDKCMLKLRGSGEEALEIMDELDSIWRGKLSESLTAAMKDLDKKHRNELLELNRKYETIDVNPRVHSLLSGRPNDAVTPFALSIKHRAESDVTRANQVLFSYATHHDKKYLSTRDKLVNEQLANRKKLEAAMIVPLQRLDAMRARFIENIEAAVRRAQLAVQHSSRLEESAKSSADPLTKLRSVKALDTAYSTYRHSLAVIAKSCGGIQSEYSAVETNVGPLQASLLPEERPQSPIHYPAALVRRDRPVTDRLTAATSTAAIALVGAEAGSNVKTVKHLKKRKKRKLKRNKKIKGSKQSAGTLSNSQQHQLQQEHPLPQEQQHHHLGGGMFRTESFVKMKLKLAAKLASSSQRPQSASPSSRDRPRSSNPYRGHSFGQSNFNNSRGAYSSPQEADDPEDTDEYADDGFIIDDENDADDGSSSEGAAYEDEFENERKNENEDQGDTSANIGDNEGSFRHSAIAHYESQQHVADDEREVTFEEYEEEYNRRIAFGTGGRMVQPQNPNLTYLKKKVLARIKSATARRCNGGGQLIQDCWAQLQQELGIPLCGYCLDPLEGPGVTFPTVHSFDKQQTKRFRERDAQLTAKALKSKTLDPKQRAFLEHREHCRKLYGHYSAPERQFCTFECTKRWLHSFQPPTLRYEGDKLIDLAAGYFVDID